jgi:hypothetical protein
MEENPATTIASGSDRPQTGAAANVNTPLDPMESAALAPADPLAAAGVEEPSTGPGTGALPGMSHGPASVAVSTNPVVSHSDSRVANPVVRISGIAEIGRDGKTSEITSWKPPFEVEKGFEAGFEKIFNRAKSVRIPMDAVPVPTASTPYGTTDELFNRLQKAIAAQACLSERASRLLTYWTLSTWFPDALSLAPSVAITGPAYEGDLILRTLRSFCRNPLMMTGITATDLKKINWQIPPTLLCYEPNLTKQMAALLGSAATRGYLFGGAGNYQDFYGPRGLYIGDEVSVARIPRCSVQVNVFSTATDCATVEASRLSELEAQDLQNRLLSYRFKNLVKVYKSDFDACGLTSDTRAIANALGACIVDSPKLQSELITLLTPAESQRQADRSTSLEAVTLEATLNLAHAGKAQILVGEVANEVNRIVEARGERLHFSAENIGHRLKRIGLVTRRLGKAGKGLLMDLATMTRAHELTAVYGGAGLDQDENNLHCPLCTEKKRFM